MKQKFVKVVLRHLQKENDFGCICGWKEPGHNWADHLYEMLIRAEVLVEGEVEVQWGSRQGELAVDLDGLAVAIFETSEDLPKEPRELGMKYARARAKIWIETYFTLLVGSENQK